MSRFVRFVLPALIWAGLIVFASSQSGPPDLQLPQGADKVIHAGIYAVLGILTARALRGFDVSPVKSARFALIACAVFGVTDELHQSTVAGRYPDTMDWIADLFGAALGAWGYVLVQQRRAQKKEEETP